MKNESLKSTAILFVHGIQGSPRQFQWILDSLPDHVRAVNLLLPGHGGDVSVFRQSGRQDWQECVNQAGEALCRHYQRVIFVGHSMGCLLGIEAARHPGIRFSAMLFLACPLSLRPTWAYFKNSLLAVSGYHGNNPYILALQAANSVHAAHPWQYAGCLHPYLELLRLVRQVNNAKKPPLPPVTAFFFQKDEIVGKCAVRLATEKYRFTTATLSDCSHDYFTSYAREKILAVVLNEVFEA